MDIHVLKPDQLSAYHLAKWTHIVERTPELESPYFRPEFTFACAAVRDDVEVAVLDHEGTAHGFFPFQRTSLVVGRPVGGRLSDLHGMIAFPGTQYCPERLIEACGLASWDFDHLPESQAPFAPHVRLRTKCATLDLSAGFEAYRAQRRAAGSETVDQVLRKARKFEREVGPLQWTEHNPEPEVFQQLLLWKSDQYRETGLTDVFRFPWTIGLLQKILRCQGGDEFRGMLSTLSVHGRVVAIHMGMRSHAVLHSWFPAYDREFARFSPGLILFMTLAQRAAEMGLERIELGKGDEPYKHNIANRYSLVGEGTVCASPVVTAVRTAWDATRSAVKRSALRDAIGPSARRLREWMAFR